MEAKVLTPSLDIRYIYNADFTWIFYKFLRNADFMGILRGFLGFNQPHQAQFLRYTFFFRSQNSHEALLGILSFEEVA